MGSRPAATRSTPLRGWSPRRLTCHVRPHIRPLFRHVVGRSRGGRLFNASMVSKPSRAISPRSTLPKTNIFSRLSFKTVGGGCGRVSSYTNVSTTLRDRR
ncbi:hypothetical protein BD311DRAFT_755101 [Dichomitus squalens]|uniref:Uncharacterized protein n=1 Tax=Dichomitus squalens TaxID=114155 RepID=A0A4Q9MUG7_9APHY|nr:hypothetical protein BD311DRAFT_755101 [Dichomitus squalens]